MSCTKLSHSMKFRPVLPEKLAALPLIAGWLFSGGFITPVSAAESPREQLSLTRTGNFTLATTGPRRCGWTGGANARPAGKNIQRCRVAHGESAA